MNHTSLTLLERLQQPGDEPAWRRFVDLYTPLIRHWLCQRCHVASADADDLTQTVMGVMVAELPRFKHNGHVGALRHWIKTVTISRLVDFCRSRQARPQAAGDTGIDQILAQWADPHSQFSALWDREHDHFLLGRAMELVEPEFEPATWQAFRRCAVEGHKTADVAQELGLTTNAIFIAKSRILARLRQELAGLAEI